MKIETKKTTQNPSFQLMLFIKSLSIKFMVSVTYIPILKISIKLLGEHELTIFPSTNDPHLDLNKNDYG